MVLLTLSLTALFFLLLWPLVKRIIRNCMYNRAKNKIPPILLRKDLSTTLVIITGSSSGIGMQLALNLAEQKASILFACRNKEKTLKVIKSIRKKVKSGDEQFLEFAHLDLVSLESVRNFAKNVADLDFPEQYEDIILVNNAGGISKSVVTDDGIDEMFQVNYIGPYMLCHLLLPVLKKTTKPSRIINVSSSMSHSAKEEHFRNTPLDEPLPNDENLHGGIRYPRSKLAMNAFTNYFHERVYRDDSIDVDIVACCPGMVMSMMMKSGIPLYVKAMFFFLDFFIKTLEQGARTPLYLCLIDYQAFTRKFGGEFVHGFVINEKYKNVLMKEQDFQDFLVEKSNELIGENFEI